MGTTLTFVGQRVVTNCVCCPILLDWAGREEVPGNNSHVQIVPQTDTGGLAEYAKALERTVLKELGKLPS